MDITIKAGTRLFHGTGEEFDIGSTRPGGYDKLFWTTDSSVIAQTYIPVSGASTRITTKWLMKPGSSYADQLGIHYTDVEKDNMGNIRSYRLNNSTLQDISNKERELSRESMRLDKERDSIINEYTKYVSDNADKSDTDEFRTKRKEYKELVLKATNAAKDALSKYQSFGATKKRHDYVNSQLEKLGYKPDETDSTTHDHTWDLKIGSGHEILPAEYRHKGRLLVVKPKRDMKIYDISTGEPDLTNPQYHKLDLFDRLQQKGYDGVKIDDFAQTEQYGNVGHSSIGFFKSAMDDMNIKSIDNVVHPKDINKHESDEYEKWSAMNEAFIGFVKSLDRGWNTSLIEAIVKGANVIFESTSYSNITLYHGSDNKFSEFAKDKSPYSLPWTQGSVGYYFTDNIKYASDYGRYVYKTTATLNNPYIVPNDSYEHTFISPERKNELISQGYDSVIYKSPSGDRNEYIIFDMDNVNIDDIIDTSEKIMLESVPSYASSFKTIDIDGEEVDIPIVSVSGTFYHGTSTDVDDEPFDEFDIDYSEYPAIWITDDKQVAAQFSKWHSGDVNYLYTVKYDSDSMVYIDQNTYSMLMNYLEINDIRDAIYFLSENGFDGWVTIGSIGNKRYNDVAVFDPSMINIVDVDQIK